ncbi:hypothetical protein J6590_051327 [Homalodisca vitripennis]|nr:hypothetical protein J6590_051327 [Homalodisca vitripennis]
MTGSTWAWWNDSVVVEVVEGGEVWTNSVVREWGQWTNQSTRTSHQETEDNWWGLLALALVFGTAAGNILVCLAISWERRLQNVTNYFLMSLAITDLMVAILVMPLGILTLVRAYGLFMRSVGKVHGTSNPIRPLKQAS